ncbi:hypothetical protein AXG93_4347s1040 [Marchantia polymorpha subsp. ruderalis]|uniref:Uncharacterized protein n=1 Tax=Marchantia polymorpha subsp. ruderalis TaxID=1480154 RepID=A0A176WQY4_MARPO|nr:hypothetical protein AXG93_4347s1040 [Marchantia polymorpha subsp. ruderalis]
MTGVDDIPDIIPENILARSTVLEVMTLRKWKRVIEKPTVPSNFRDSNTESGYIAKGSGQTRKMRLDAHYAETADSRKSSCKEGQEQPLKAN